MKYSYLSVVLKIQYLKKNVLIPWDIISVDTDYDDVDDVVSSGLTTHDAHKSINQSRQTVAHDRC